jgi:hypothetical protein
VKKRLMRLAASVGFVVAVAIGAIVMTPSEASAATVPCGYTKTGEGNLYVTKIVYFTIRNCHNYPVWRKFDIAGGPDSRCWYFPAGYTWRYWFPLEAWQDIRGIKPC